MGELRVPLGLHLSTVHGTLFHQRLMFPIKCFRYHYNKIMCFQCNHAAVVCTKFCCDSYMKIRYWSCGNIIFFSHVSVLSRLVGVWRPLCPGTHFTIGYELLIHVLGKYVLLLQVNTSTNQFKIWHMPWQLSCHGICKIVIWLNH